MEGSKLESDASENDASLFFNFASTTTAHGFSKLAEARHFVGKVIWTVLLTAAAIGVITSLAFR